MEKGGGGEEWKEGGGGGPGSWWWQIYRRSFWDGLIPGMFSDQILRPWWIADLRAQVIPGHLSLSGEALGLQDKTFDVKKNWSCNRFPHTVFFITVDKMFTFQDEKKVALRHHQMLLFTTDEMYYFYL